MKKLLLIILTGSLGLICADANNSSLFSYNNELVDQELAEISLLEQYVYDNQGTTLNELPDDFSYLADNLDRSFDPVEERDDTKNPVFGIPSFCWGFCFSVPGIILVHVITGDYDESQKAFKGCVTMTIISVASYAVYIILVLVGIAATGGYYYF